MLFFLQVMVQYGIIISDTGQFTYILISQEGKMRKFVSFVIASLVMLTLVACGNIDDGSKKSEIDMIKEVRTHDIGTYAIERYDVMYTLGEQNELVILELPKGRSFILADNPEKGNHFYEEVLLQKNLKPIGASGKYIFFESGFGNRFAIYRVKESKDVRVGEGIIMGSDVAIPFDELTEEEKEFIHISDKVPAETTN